MQLPGAERHRATPQGIADAPLPDGNGKQRDQHHRGRDRGALEVAHLARLVGQRFCRDVEARQAGYPAGDEVEQHHAIPAALHARGVGDRRRRDAEGDDVGERIELAPERRGDVPPARHLAVEHVEHQRKRHQRAGEQQPPGLGRRLQVGHHGEQRAGAAEGVTDGDPVGEVKAADHREAAWRGHRASSLRTGQPILAEPADPQDDHVGRRLRPARAGASRTSVHAPD